MILEHVGLTVRDLDRSIAFYTDVLGFHLLRRTSSNAYLHMGEELVELMQATEAPEQTAGQAATTMERMLSTVGLNHIGFRVDDLGAALEEIEGRGGAIVTPPFDFTPEIEFAVDGETDKLKRVAQPVGTASWRIAVIEDPDGTMLELLER